MRGKAIIVAYHAITPRAEREGGCGERSLYVHQRTFGEQLDIMRDVADVVSLEQLDTMPAQQSARPRVAITFDDAYHGAVTCAIDELVSRSLPATIFVAPGCLGGQVFWWDALSHTVGEMPESVRMHALQTLKGDGATILRWASDNGMAVRTDLPPHAKSATIDELVAATKRPGITVGSHTWSHANLAGLTGDALRSELQRSREWMTVHAAGHFVPHLAYPYGLESPAAREATEAAGYSSGLCITGGWHEPLRAPRFARPRLNIGAGMTLPGLRARLLGSRKT